MKEFKNGKWVEKEDEFALVPIEAPPKKKYTDPRDIEPAPPKPPVDDNDRPRWVAENVRYLEKLSDFRARQTFKMEHPELKNKSWHVKEEE